MSCCLPFPPSSTTSSLCHLLEYHSGLLPTAGLLLCVDPDLLKALGMVQGPASDRVLPVNGCRVPVKSERMADSGGEG